MTISANVVGNILSLSNVEECYYSNQSRVGVGNLRDGLTLVGVIAFFNI